MDKDGKNIVIVAILAISILNFGMIANIASVLRSGEYLSKAQVQFIISADAPWETLPPFIKEYISRKALLETKLDKNDMIQIRDWYDKQIKNYKNEIVLRTETTYPEKKGGQ